MAPSPRQYKPSTKQEKMHQWDLKKTTYAWSGEIDYRKNPEKYKVGKGEQGVLICEPYKGEILSHWRFKNPEIAQTSADQIFSLF